MGIRKSAMRRLGSSARNRQPRFLAGWLLVAAALLAFTPNLRSAWAQTYDPGDNDRKVVKKVDPDYPDTLKRLFIGGVVRVEVSVAPSGAVNSTKLVGGSPILGQAAMKAIQQWKFVPAAAQQTLTVRINFDPHK